jgi:Tfp pilus assembly PilM family ATPase
MSKIRNRKSYKKQVTFRINTKLIEKIDRYIDKMNNEGLSIKKIDLVETAIYKYMKELTDEKK